jgi:hypothetical protein
MLRCDNQAAIQIASHDTHHNRSKHIDIRYHFIREIVQRGEVVLSWVGTKEQEADLYTKALGGNTFKELRDKIIIKQ